VHANRPLNSFEALRGQKIRVWSKETGDLVKTIGAVPVTVTFKETYPSLEKGIIDGGLTAIFAAHDYKWWEVVKYTTWWNFSFPTDFTVVNLKAFNKLPADLQAIVLKVGAEYEAKLQKELEMYTYYCAAKGITKYAVTMTGLTPEFHSSLRERMKPVIWDDWAKRCPGDLGERFLKVVDEELRKQ